MCHNIDVNIIFLRRSLIFLWHQSLTDLQEESPLAKITRDSAKITVEQVHGLMSQVIANSILLRKRIISKKYF